MRPGGVVAFMTSRYTMDVQNPSVRRYLAQRADLLGAIRLPNNAFKANAGTEVVSDILFLQKRDRAIDIEPDWVHLGQTEDGYAIGDLYHTHQPGAWQIGWILYTGIPDCPSHKSYVNEGIFKQGIQSQIPCAADAIQRRIHVILNHGHIK